MPRLGVLGWPVAHSRSPAIQNAALAALGLSDWHYQRLPVPPALFAETTRALGAAGFAGANVTIPHKEAALALADETSERARADRRGEHAELRRRRGDPRGLEHRRPGPARGARDRRPRGSARRCSARAAARVPRSGRSSMRGRPRCSCGTARRARAERLAAGTRRQLVDRPQKADLLVNCTSVGLHVERSSAEDGGLNQLGLRGDQIGEYSYVADLVYRSSPTPLLAAAEARGARTVDGLDIPRRAGRPQPRAVDRP